MIFFFALEWYHFFLVTQDWREQNTQYKQLQKRQFCFDSQFGGSDCHSLAVIYRAWDSCSCSFYILCKRTECWVQVVRSQIPFKFSSAFDHTQWTSSRKYLTKSSLEGSQVPTSTASWNSTCPFGIFRYLKPFAGIQRYT